MNKRIFSIPIVERQVLTQEQYADIAKSDSDSDSDIHIAAVERPTD